MIYHKPMQHQNLIDCVTKIFNYLKSIINNYKLYVYVELINKKINYNSWKWNSSINANTSSTLTNQGWQDEKLLALRNKARFSNILSLPYSEKDFLVGIYK